MPIQGSADNENLRRDVERLVLELREAQRDIAVVSGIAASDPFVGQIIIEAGITDDPPSGWLVCAGAAVSRSTYASLFAKVGTVFGVGDGSTTFNLPTIAAAVANTRYVIYTGVTT